MKLHYVQISSYDAALHCFYRPSLDSCIPAMESTWIPNFLYKSKQMAVTIEDVGIMERL